MGRAAWFCQPARPAAGDGSDHRPGRPLETGLAQTPYFLLAQAVPERKMLSWPEPAPERPMSSWPDPVGSVSDRRQLAVIVGWRSVAGGVQVVGSASGWSPERMSLTVSGSPGNQT